VILADIQVRVATADGPVYLDGIQKVFPVGQYLAAGFAGDVEFGYRLIEDLAQCLRLPPGDDRAWIPAPTIDRWRVRARSLFNEWGQPERRANLLVAGVREEGVIPNEADAVIAHIVPPGVRTYACILRSPAFEVEVIRPMTVGSIGSGNAVEAYQGILEHVNQHPASYYHSEFVGGVRDSFGTMLAHSLGADIARTAAPGISQHLLVCIVRPGEITLQPNDSDVFEAGQRRPERRMPPLARSLRQVHELLERNGLAEGDAVNAVA